MPMQASTSRFRNVPQRENGDLMEATKRIACVLYPGLTPLDLIGPLQVLAPLSRIDPTFEITVVGASRDVVETDAVVGLVSSHAFDDVPSPFAIIVPGGGAPT